MTDIYGLTCTEEQSACVILPVPWEATTSYGGGTSNGPAAILKASIQLDLFDFELGRVYEPGIFMLPENQKIRKLGDAAGVKGRSIKDLEGAIENRSDTADLKVSLAEVNAACDEMNQFVREETARILAKDKVAAVVGGDHSVPFGSFQAHAEKFGPYGILHFDAHSDTRNAYEGFTWSHASIMHNTLERIPEVEKIVQVGIRDFCEEEFEYMRSQGDRAKVFYDPELTRRKFSGEPWGDISRKIVEELPKQVFVSFDIDGLDPRFCPNTGTPVPGGLDFIEAVHVIAEVARSGRTIIGFDLNEVSPGPDLSDEWNGNVGMRLLYKLIGWTFATQGKIKPR